jgi:hypothetical protein
MVLCSVRTARFFFRASEADYGFTYRVRADGRHLRKVSDHTIYSTVSVSPDGEYLIVYGRADEHVPGVTPALPVRGGPPLPIYSRFASLKWSRDGALLFVSVPKHVLLRTGRKDVHYVIASRTGFSAYPGGRLSIGGSDCSFRRRSSD